MEQIRGNNRCMSAVHAFRKSNPVAVILDAVIVFCLLIAQPSIDRRFRAFAEVPAETESATANQSRSVDDVLSRWEAESAKVTTIEGQFVRRDFLRAFSTEKVTDGKFIRQRPDKGRIEYVARTPKRGEVGTRKDPNGERYRLERSTSEHWIWDGTDLVTINLDDRTYWRDTIPEKFPRSLADRSWFEVGLEAMYSFERHLPFVYGMKAEEALNKYTWTIVPLTAERHQEWVQLKAVPRTENERQSFSEIWVILDRSTFVTKYVRCVDPNGVESVYAYEIVRINAKPTPDAFIPNLEGMKEVVTFVK